MSEENHFLDTKTYYKQCFDNCREEYIKFIQMQDIDAVCTFEITKEGHYVFKGFSQKKLNWWQRLKDFFKRGGR